MSNITYICLQINNHSFASTTNYALSACYIFVRGTMNISGEWLFLLNVAYLFIMIQFVEHLFQNRVRKWRKITAIMISSFLSTVYFSTVWGGIASFFVAILIAYFPNWRTLLQQGSVLLLTTCLVGGVLTAMHTLFMLHEASYVAVLFVVVILFFLLRTWQKIKQHRTDIPFISEAVITIFQQQLHVKAFYDNGNRCIEPLSGQPVHFLAFDAIAPYLDFTLREALHRWNEQKPYDVTMFPQEVKKTMRFISLETVGQRHVVLAFRVQQLIVSGKHFANHYVVLTKRAKHFPQQSKLILQCSTEFQQKEENRCLKR